MLFEILGKEDSEDDDEPLPPPPEQAVPAPAPATRGLPPRKRAGRDLRVLIREVHRLEREGKTKDAGKALDRVETGGAIADAQKRPTHGLITKRAKEIRDLVFQQGDLITTRRIVEAFLQDTEMKLLLPDHLRQTSKDAETAKMMLQAAKTWVKDLMKTKGRRTDEDRNALLASMSALMPQDLFKLRRGRSAMRALGLTWAITSQAVKARGALEDKSKGWKRVHTSPHCDRLEIEPIDRWYPARISTQEVEHDGCS